MSANEETAPNQVNGAREKIREICRALNIDAETEKQALEAYETARDQFELTGDPNGWICCALYVACLQELPAVGHPDQYVQFNGVNITNLLTECNMNIQDFFSKMKHWSEIRSLPARLQKTLDNLQHVFSVSIMTYEMYYEVFRSIFNEANIVPDEPKRNKKSKPNPCSYNKLREFCWLLFLAVKEEHIEQRHDLATAKDLCVCVLDLVYRNVVAEGRMDLINPKVLSEGGISSVDGTPAAAEAAMNVNLKEQLCNEYRTSFESVDETNVNMFLPSLSGMVDANDLKATLVTNLSVKTYTGLVSVSNFEENLKSLNRRYERSSLRCGMLDERIALNSRVSPTSQRNRWNVNIVGHPLTPLSIKSGRAAGALVNANRIGLDVGRADTNDGSGSEMAANSTFFVRGSLRQLTKIIHGHHRGKPRESFMLLMKNCTPSPLPTVLKHVGVMREKFKVKLAEGEGWNSRTVETRFDAIEALYYQLLENIIPWEFKKRSTMTVSKVIFELCTNNTFNETLIVCAAEIIFFLRQEQHNFPWILDVFVIEPFLFFSIIEVTVSANSETFTSDIVNHLRRIEEQLVDSISWKSSSILWEYMEREKYKIPTYKEVEHRSEIAGVTPLKGVSVPNTPNGTRGGNSSGIAGSTACPSSSTVASATGRQAPHPDSAKKKLFIDPATPSKIQPTSAPSSSTTSSGSGAGSGTGQTVTPPEMANVSANAINGSNDTNSISSLSSPQRSTNDQSSSSLERRLNFFFRKMYQVAYPRLRNLCQNLGIDSDVIEKLIWTIFEFTITKYSKDLMRDRHLDQLLMCAIFVTVRIKKLPNTFKQIMHCYHFQPQANSSIYRSVFIRYENPPPAAVDTSNEEGTNGRNGESINENARLPVTGMAGTSVQYDREVYGDIIKFYNDIYVLKVHEFALKYYNSDASQESLFLSPTPKSQARNIQKSPRQIAGINLFVSTTNKISSLKDSPNVRVLTFPSSPGQSPTIHERKIPLSGREKPEDSPNVRVLTYPEKSEDTPNARVLTYPLDTAAGPTMHERKMPLLGREKPEDTVIRKRTPSTAFEQQSVPSKRKRLEKFHQDRKHQDHESSGNE